jgi:hypothetical protein
MRSGCSPGAVRSRDGVLEQYRASFRIDVMINELELSSLRGVWEQWQTAAEEHGDQCDLNRVDQPEFEQAAEQPAAAEEPDVLPRLRLEGGDSRRRIV